MKRLIFFILILILAVGLGLLIKADPGYLLLSYRNWTMETPLWIGIILIFLLFLAAHWLLQFFNFSAAAPRRISLWSNHRKAQQADIKRDKGLLALAAGNWKVAENLLARSAKVSKTPLINYLTAARAAQEAGRYAKRDEYIKLAYNIQPTEKLAVELTQAKLQMRQRQWEQALATLKHLRELAPRHTYVLKLLKQLYIQLNDWEGLAAILPDLRKNSVITTKQATELELQIYQHILQLSAGKEKKAKEKKELDAIWNHLPRHLRKNPLLIETYSTYLIDNNYHQEAEKLLRNAIKSQWNDKLVSLYGLLTEPDAKKQLAIATSWIKHHKDNPILLLTLGRLAMANQLWGRARSYLENSLDYQPSTETFHELGKLFEQLGEERLAKEAFRKGIEAKTAAAFTAAMNSDVY